MIRYIHFAFENIFLLNGYRETETPNGLEREYDAEDKLEQCVQRLLLRKNESLRGWDLRFMRRSLGLSQADFGQMIDRDGQSVARWEKASECIPKFVDLAIRARFASEHEPQMTVRELLQFIEGHGKKLPTEICLRYVNGDWHLDNAYPVSYTETANLTVKFIAPSTGHASFVKWKKYLELTERPFSYPQAIISVEDFRHKEFLHLSDFSSGDPTGISEQMALVPNYEKLIHGTVRTIQ